jgi:hypothetical protein
MNMPCVFRAEMGGGPTNTGETVLRHVEVKKEACRRFAEGTHLVGLGPGGRLFHAGRSCAPQRPPRAGGVLQRASADRPQQDAPEDPAAPDRGGHARADVLGRHRFPRRSGAGQHPEHGSDRTDLRGGRARSARRRRPPIVHAGHRAHSGSAHGKKSGGQQRGSLPDCAHGGGHRAGRPGRRCLEARQSCGGPLPRSRPESAGERSGARCHGDIRTHVPDRISSVVGESRETSGEGRDVASLDLSGLQEDLIQAVHAAGTPTVVVLINGRPLSTRWVAEHIPAIVGAWLPGEQGGHAVAEVLFGDVNPGGRLPVTVPRHVG